MAVELGYEGGKTIFDEYVREVRPRFVAPRTFQRTIYRPGELVQCDLWDPRDLIPVGYGQSRRGWVVTSEVCWSRAIAGTLVFSKEAPDILWGLVRNLTTQIHASDSPQPACPDVMRAPRDTRNPGLGEQRQPPHSRLIGLSTGLATSSSSPGARATGWCCAPPASRCRDWT
jgi:hypothetical protein